MKQTVFNKIDGAIGKLTKVLETISAVLVAILTIVVVLEVVSRYFFSMPIAITGELTNLAFPWITACAAIIITIQEEHISLVFIKEKFARKSRFFLDVLIQVLGIVFSGIMVYSSIVFCMDIKNQTMALLGISKVFLYGAIVFLFTLTTVLLVYQLIKLILKYKEGVER